MDHLKLCIESALAGGEAVVATKSRETQAKNDPLGHHAIVTPADYNSQKAILETILANDTQSLFMTEEHVPELLQRRTITRDNLARLKDTGVYIIDELDGTSSRSIGHYEWSVSVGFVKKLESIAGAVLSPEIFGGALFFASKGEGGFMRTGLKTEFTKESPMKVQNNSLDESYLICGVDCNLTRYPIHNQLIHLLADKSRTLNLNGSCALPLGLVAAGCADALIQPPQSPWDYAAGRLLVEEAGGRVIFYEMQNGRINPIETLSPIHYNPNTKEVGFVAANPHLAEQIMDILVSI
jgi:fructose-1,6-bisphosphatase/inositol monophosphatase family enzyme